MDLDGTLAPIAPTPAEARIPAETLGALRRLIRNGWKVAVISGRQVSEVRELVPLRGIRAFGSHGLEGSWKGLGRTALPTGLRQRLARLAKRAGALAKTVPGAVIEHKPAGVAFHDRQVPRNRLPEWRRTLDRWLAEQNLEGLERIRGRRVTELRPAGVHKGVVVRGLPKRPGRPRPDDSLVAMGDDLTDEDMFRELQGQGLTVRVGRRRGTLAVTRLPSTSAVSRFLTRLAEEAAR